MNNRYLNLYRSILILATFLCITSNSALGAAPSDLFQGIDSIVGEARLPHRDS
jgi:hypothetical protein